MVQNLIDICTEEVFISDTLAAIKKQFRPLMSVKAKWYIHRILPKDLILTEWKSRIRLDLEIDISQWFSSRDKLERLFWHEMMLVKDELDPKFEFPVDYVRDTYGPNAPRAKYYALVRAVWCVHAAGRLHRMGLPSCTQHEVNENFIECFGHYPETNELFQKIYEHTGEYTFKDIENIARQLYKIRKDREQGPINIPDLPQRPPSVQGNKAGF